MLCNICNHKLPDDSEFCQYCGNKIEKINSVSTENISIVQENYINSSNYENDENFGLIPYNPIYTLTLKSVNGQKEYLNKLYTENGEKIKWNRRGSVCVKGINGMVDVYDTYLPSGLLYKTLYFNMYGERESTKAPYGFVLNNSKYIEKESRKQKVVKTKYCSFCGMLIDNESKKCTGCGKQYFNGIKINKLFVIILLSVLLISSVVLNAVQLIAGNQVKQELDVALGKNNKLLNEVANLESKVKSKESEVSKLAKQVASQKELVEFIDNYVVFEENDGTNRYHKFNCKKFKKNKFYVYNLSQAGTWGTYPCPSCH